MEWKPEVVQLGGGGPGKVHRAVRGRRRERGSSTAVVGVVNDTTNQPASAVAGPFAPRVIFSFVGVRRSRVNDATPTLSSA